MSFFSKAKQKIKKAVSSLGKVLSKNRSSLTASPLGVVATSNKKTVQQPGRSTPLPTARTITPAPRQVSGLSTPALKTPLPTRTISSAPGQVSGRSSPIYSSPITIGGGSNRTSISPIETLSFSSLSSAPSSFGSITTQSTAPTASISLPSKPSMSNPGPINNGGLIGSLAETHTYDANTNSFLPIVETQSPEEDKSQSRLKKLIGLIPEKESVYEDPEIQRQQKEVKKRQQEVNEYTSQLNSIVAQQNTDLLRLREIGSKEGVTETVYGGQAATINREAAIKALPIQAQISAAQGNLELAQDYLTQLTTWKQEQIDADYSHQKEVYSIVKEFSDEEEKREFDKLEKEDDRAYKEGRELISEQDYWVRQAVENGQPGLISRINNTRSRQELANVVSGMRPKASEGDKEIGSLDSILSQLLQSRDVGPEADGEYADPNLYATLRATARISASDFDKKFGYLVNPASQSRLGLGDSTSLNFDDL